MKILNLYAGIGGNRKLWGSEHQIVAVELCPDIAEVYSSLYPEDNVIVGDAHKYLEKNFSRFDFIRSSPPCPSHGQYRHNVGVIGKGFAPILPDMRLYSEIIFLSYYFKGLYVVENVKPYYKVLVPHKFELSRHLFWSNFGVPSKVFQPAEIRSKNKIRDFDDYECVEKSRIKDKRQVLRNCVDPSVGQWVLQYALNVPNPTEGNSIV